MGMKMEKNKIIKKTEFNFFCRNWFFILCFIFLQIIRYDTFGACGILLLNFIILIRSCKISEFACKGSGLCLPLDKYCDGIDQCGDLSDEPKFCTGTEIYKFFFIYIKSRHTKNYFLTWRLSFTVCNRTYYGDIGRTYSIQVPTPQRFPFLCHLTFTASGHEQGDIVQVGMIFLIFFFYIFY